MKEMILQELDDHQQVIDQVIATSQESIYRMADLLSDVIRRQGKLMIAGNGGSAADAQHIAAELVGRYMKERRSLPALSLATDTSALTAIGNDYGYDRVFSRQVEGLGRRGDVLMVISTSGNSQNLLLAVDQAEQMGIKTVALLGKDGGKLKGRCDLEIIIPSEHTPRIQEMHILIGHILCKAIEEAV